MAARKVEVEVFETQEVGADGSPDFATPEAVAEFKARCQRMGLKGQVSLVTEALSADGVAAAPTVFPFRPATREEVFAYSTLLPRAVAVEDFKGEAIPMRVLEVLERAKETGQFKCFEVWTPEDPSQPDPVLVGFFPEPGYPTLKRQPHVLARWGAALAPFPEVLRSALQRFRDRTVQRLKAVQREVANDLAFAESIDPASAIVPTNHGTPYYHGAVGA